ncbi:MAG: TA system VapC family ribonuclease toxin [Bacteroidota bacterium]
MTPDINVLVAASRADHAHHAPARSWLEEGLHRVRTEGRLGLLPMVTAGFLRLVTNKRIFPVPTPLREATAFIDALTIRPGVVLLDLPPVWDDLARLCERQQLISNAVPDAWIAVAVRAHAEHLVTFDRDFITLLPPAHLTLLGQS